MNKKVVQIAIGILCTVFVVVGITFFLLQNRRIEQTIFNENGQDLSFIGNLPQSGNLLTTEPTVTQPNLSGVGITDADFQTQVIAEDLKKRSINFIERLGSYSSDSSLSNFDDLIPQTTASLELDLRATKHQRLQEFNNSDLFVGYTITAVTSSADLSNIDDGSIVVSIDAMRDVSGLNTETTINDQLLYRLSWVKGEDGQWRVNEISGDF